MPEQLTPVTMAKLTSEADLSPVNTLGAYVATMKVIVESIQDPSIKSIIERDTLVKKAKTFPKAPTSDEEMEMQAKCVQECKGLLDNTEDIRVAYKKPADQIGKLIQAKAAAYIGPVEKEQARLKSQIAHYQQKELERKAIEQRRVAVETARIADEQRKLLADLGQAVEAGDFEAELALETKALEIPAAPMPVVVAPVKVAGMSSRQAFDFEVTNWNAFLLAFPQFWEWKADDEMLKLKRRDISGVLNTPGQRIFAIVDGLPTAPGLRVFSDIKTSFR